MAHGPSHFLKRTFMEIHGGSRKSGWGHFHGNYGELWRTTDPFCLGQPGNGRGRARTEHNGTKCSAVFRVRTVFQEHSSLRCLPPRQAAASRGPHRRPPPAVPRSAAHRPRRPGLAGQQCSRPAGGAFRLCLPPPALWSGIVGSQSRGANVPRIKSQRFSPLDFAGLPGRAGPGRAARGCMARLGSQDYTKPGHMRTFRDPHEQGRGVWGTSPTSCHRNIQGLYHLPCQPVDLACLVFICLFADLQVGGF